MDRTLLAALAKDLGNARVLCVGDAMLDRFVQGSVGRISPEAPIPVLKVERENAMLGGAGNVVRNVGALGGSVHFISAVGDDAPGREVRALLDQAKGASSTLIDWGPRPTSVKTRFIAARQQMLRADAESSESVGERIGRRLIDALARHIGDYEVLVLSDYGKGLLANGVAAEMISIAKKAGKAVVVDPKGTDYSAYAGASVVTPNRRELADVTGGAVNDDASVIEAAESLIRGCRFGAVLATRGQDGMTLVRSDDQAIHLTAEAREVFDVSGAGDTVVAALSAAISVGATLENAADIANVAAGVVVGKAGTAAAHVRDVVAAIHRRDPRKAGHKILDIAAMMDEVDRWRGRDLTIGFANGCFDLLHPGHLSLLKQAAAACDRLIVGLNSDASVKRLKGPARPIQDEGARATVLASLGMVDAVVVFEQDTPLELVEALLPDVLVKGEDYGEDEIVGGPAVKAAGGRVLLATLEPGHSTTNTIAKLKATT